MTGHSTGVDTVRASEHGGSNPVTLTWDYLSDSDNWSGSGGIADRLMEHVALSVGALLIAALIALPIGTVIGHGRRGDDLPIAIGAAGRLLPSLGVFCYLALKVDTGNDAVLVALVLLALPPMMTAAYTGVRLVDATTVEAARGAGMMPNQILRHVEIPMAMPQLVAGVRKSARQVVAMAAVGAFVGAGGLGRLIIDGQAADVRDYGQVATGGILIALVAVALDGLLALIGHQLISPGVARRQRPPVRTAAPAPAPDPAPAGATTYPTLPGAPPPPVT